MYILAFLIAIALAIWTGKLEFQHRHVTFMLWPLSIVFLYLPMIIFAFNGQEYLKNGIYNIFSFISLCNLAYLFSFLLLRSKFISPMNYKQVSDQSYQKYIMIGLLFSAAILILLSDLSIYRVLQSDLKDKQSLGLLYLLFIFIICLLGGQVIASLENRNYSLLIISSILSIFLMMYFRSRSIIAVFIFSYLYYYLWVRNGSIYKVALIGVASGFLATALKAIRYQGELSNITDFSKLKNTFIFIFENLLETGDLSIHKYLYFIFENCSTLSFCFKYSNAQKLISHTQLVSAPDTLFEYALYDVYAEQGVGGSLHPSIYGIAYGDNGYLLGILFMFALGLFCFAVSRLCNSRNFYYFIGFISYYVTFVSRGSFYNATVLLLVGIGLVFALRIIEVFMNTNKIPPLLLLQARRK